MGNNLAVLLAILVLVVIAIVAYFLFTAPFITRLISQTNPVQNDVVVGGIIKTGFSTSPSGINFTSKKTGQTSYATIDKNGHYSITVLGNDTYNVTIYYSSLFGVSTSKSCRAVLSFNNMVTVSNFSTSC